MATVVPVQNENFSFDEPKFISVSATKMSPFENSRRNQCMSEGLFQVKLSYQIDRALTGLSQR